MVDIERLRRKTIFEGLTDEQLDSLAAQTQERHYAAGDVVIRAGETGERVYVIERGCVEVLGPSAETGGEPPVFARLSRGRTDEGVGDFFGEFCLFDLEPRTADVVAREATVLLELGRESLFDLFERDGELRITVALNVARVLAHRLRAANREPRE